MSRVLTRLLREAGQYVALCFSNHLKRAKRRAMAIQHPAKAEPRLPLYCDLVVLARNTFEAAEFAVKKLGDFIRVKPSTRPICTSCIPP